MESKTASNSLPTIFKIKVILNIYCFQGTKNKQHNILDYEWCVSVCCVRTCVCVCVCVSFGG